MDESVWLEMCYRNTARQKVGNNPMEYECKLHLGSAFEDSGEKKDGRREQRTGDSMSSSNWTEQRSHLSNVWARCMIFLTIFSRSVCSSNRSLTTSKSAWTRAEDNTAIDMTPPHLTTTKHHISVGRVLWGLLFLFCFLHKHNTIKITIYILLPSTAGMIYCDCSPSLNCFLYHSSLHWVVVSLCLLPLLINVWHKLVHPLTFPMRLSPLIASPPPSRQHIRRKCPCRARWLSDRPPPPRLQRQQVGCHWSILGLAVSIMGVVVMLILRTRRRRGWLGLLYWLLLCSLPGSGRTPSARRQTVGRWRWRCRRKAGTSAAPGHGECCNACLKDTLNKHKQVQFCCHVHTHTNTHKHFAWAASYSSY